jgi:hypothetical protein
MLERDRQSLSKYAIDPEIEEQFEGFELPDFGSKVDIDPDLDDIGLDEMDDDLWGDH